MPVFPFQNSMRRSIFWFALAAVFLFGSIAAEILYEHVSRVESWNDIGVQLPLPPPEWFEKISFGFRNVIADALWIDAIQIFTRWDAQSPGFPQHFDAIAKLAPRFEYPYLFGVLVLPGYGGPKFLERAHILAKQGMAALPDDWKIPFYLGVQYHIVGKDYRQALTYINYAADNLSAPPMVAAMRAVYTAKSGSFEKARALMVVLEKTADNDFTRDTARAWLERIDLLESIERAVRGYQEKFGFAPGTISELTHAGFLPAGQTFENLGVIIQPDGAIIFKK